MDRQEINEVRAFINGGSEHFESVEEAQEFLDMYKWAEQEAREVRWANEDEARYQASPQAKIDEHRRRADEVAVVRRKFDSSADGYRHAAAKVVRGRENEHLPADEFQEFCRSADRLLADANRADKLAKLEKRERRAAQASVVAEPGPYDEGSPNSWARDTLVFRSPGLAGFVADRSGVSDMSDGAIADRLAKHSRDVSRAVLKHSKYGRRVERMISEQHRCEDPDLHARKAAEEVRSVRFAEVRAFGTGGGATASASGGGAAAFVAPAFLMQAWADYRSPYRAFADQLNTSVSLPAFGLAAYLPEMTSGSSVTTQVEGSGVAEGDPVATFGTSPIVTKVGQIAVSQQFLDRAGPGIAGDQILFQQIKNQLAAQVDSYALAQALANAQTVTNSGTFALANATAGVGGFLGDLKKAKSKLTDTAGTRIRGTHCFATSDFVDYIGAYSDGNARPVFAPELDDNRLPIRSQGDQMAEGYSGNVLGGLARFADDSVPLSGSNTQVIVTRADTILLLEGAAIPYCYPPTFAGNLEAVLGVREYVATIPRYPSGVATVSGAAYAASTFA